MVDTRIASVEEYLHKVLDNPYNGLEGFEAMTALRILKQGTKEEVEELLERFEPWRRE